MDQSCWLEAGAIDHLGQILDDREAESLLLVTDKVAYEHSGAKSALSDTFAQRRIISFNDFESNPDLHAVQRGLDTVGDSTFDTAIAIGGGTAIDLAKLITTLAVQDDAPRAIIEGSATLSRDGVPLIAIPTTAGTGSEATRFAVVYVDGQKQSPQHDYLLPEYAIVDPRLTYSLPPHITASSGLDAMAQAMESLWSVRSTAESRRCATQALRLAVSNLEDAVKEPSPESRQAMCQAGHLSGQAINISNTTASHAISYALTSRFGVPHGSAVALTLGSILVFNSRVSAGDCTDPRGADHVVQTVNEIVHILGCISVEEAKTRITAIVRTVGCPTQLHQVGAAADDDVTFLVNQVNVQRLANNPRKLPRESLRDLLEQLR